jgi:hypothetical protein
MTKMTDEQFARLRTRRNNIARYHRLLQTQLTDHEREFVERRLSEEQSNFESLAASTLPITWDVPDASEANEAA